MWESILLNEKHVLDHPDSVQLGHPGPEKLILELFPESSKFKARYTFLVTTKGSPLRSKMFIF